MRRIARTAQFSPALGVMMLVAGVAVTCYVYRRVILTTLIVAISVMCLVTGIALLVKVAIHVIRWDRKKLTEESVSQEADWLADEEVELAWSPDGTTLEASDGKTLRIRGSDPRSPEV